VKGRSLAYKYRVHQVNKGGKTEGENTKEENREGRTGGREEQTQRKKQHREGEGDEKNKHRRGKRIGGGNGRRYRGKKTEQENKEKTSRKEPNTGRKTEQENKEKNKQKKKNHQREPASSSPSFLHL